MRIKMRIFNRTGRMRQAYGQAEGEVIREGGRHGPTRSLVGNPTFEDRAPKRISLSALLTETLPKPTSDKLMGLFYEGSIFPIPTRRGQIPDDVPGRLAISSAIYDVAHDKAVAEAENVAHANETMWSRGMFIMAGLGLVAFVIVFMVKNVRQ